MRTVFKLDATDYLMVLDGVRQLCIVGHLDMTMSIKFQDGPRLRSVCNMVLETYPGFGEFDDPKWPIEAFIYVVLKGSTEKAKKLEKPRAAPAPALTKDKQVAWQELHRVAQRQATLAQHEARRASTLQAETEDDPETIDIDGANRVGVEPPIEPPASTARTHPTTRTPVHIPAEAVVTPADPSTRPPVSVCPRSRATTPLDPAPPAEPTELTHAPPRASAEPTPPASEPAPTAPTQLVTRPPTSGTSSGTTGQPFGGLLTLASHSNTVLSRVGSAFLDLGVPDDDNKLSDAPPTELESQPAGKGKGKAASKGAKGGKVSEGGSAASEKAATKGSKQAAKKAANQASTNTPAPAAATRTRRNANR
ncbi:hypothetical protein FRC06_003459, partial [Ceratobasidium sp. 370]